MASWMTTERSSFLAFMRRNILKKKEEIVRIRGVEKFDYTVKYLHGNGNIVR